MEGVELGLPLFFYKKAGIFVFILLLITELCIPECLFGDCSNSNGSVGISASMLVVLRIH